VYKETTQKLIQTFFFVKRKRRDELSHNIFLMLQECNKFREHQAREVLISMLQQQLESRQAALSELKEEVREAEIALGVPQTSEN
jgi:multidrug resistance efflux pump